jgi:hypothetical protein
MVQSQLHLPQGRVPIDNTSFEFREDLGWIQHEDEVGRLLLNSVREDEKLYEHAVERLHRLELKARALIGISGGEAA